MLNEKLNVEPLNTLKQEDTFIYTGDMMGKPRMSKADRWRKRPCVLRYWEIKDELVRQLGNFKLTDVFYVRFEIAMPKSWSKKKKEQMLGKPHQQKPDNSNLLKGFEDMILKDDSSVWFSIPSKVWGNKTRVVLKNIDDDKLKKIQEMFV